MADGTIDTRDLLDACGGDGDSSVELLREILGHVIRQNTERMELARAALEAGERLELARIAHAVKGSAALVGARRLVDIARGLEQAATTAAPEALATSVAELEAEFHAVVEALRARHPEATG